MPSMSSAAAATATAVVPSQARNRITGDSVSGGLPRGLAAGRPRSGEVEGLDDLVLGVGQVLDEEGVRRVDVVALEQPDQGGVGVGLVVGGAAGPVDLGKSQLQLDDEVLLHRAQRGRAGQADQRDVEGEVALV